MKEMMSSDHDVASWDGELTKVLNENSPEKYELLGSRKCMG